MKERDLKIMGKNTDIMSKNILIANQSYNFKKLIKKTKGKIKARIKH
jgi:hypothetical protein